jgi:4-hydroxy-3-methylbut-2-enyl diphosphate reductase
VNIVIPKQSDNPAVVNIVIPKHSGFCYGVKRSVQVAFALAREGNAYMYGEVVHNPTVIRTLQKNGLALIHDLSQLPADTPPGTKILLRAHGVPLNAAEEITARKFTTVDMTCPHVKKIHVLAARASARGMDVIVCGTPNHPEVAGIVSRVTTQVLVVRDAEEARELFPAHSFSPQGVTLVAQTTHNHKNYSDVHAFLLNECPRISKIEAHDTVCEATVMRQNEIRTLAQQADVCIIVGGKNSSNVTKLYEIARECCVHAYHVESADGLDVIDFALLKDARNIMLAGGASTPDEDVLAVRERIK